MFPKTYWLSQIQNLILVKDIFSGNNFIDSKGCQIIGLKSSKKQKTGNKQSILNKKQSEFKVEKNQIWYRKNKCQMTLVLVIARCHSFRKVIDSVFSV
jgi:hypothetical protein